MAYVRKADRQIDNHTGIIEATELFTTTELAYVNVLAALFDAHIKSEGEGKRSRIGSWQGLYEVGFNDLNPVVAKLRSVLLDNDQWETAERLLVAHGYVVTFGML